MRKRLEGVSGNASRAEEAPPLTGEAIGSQCGGLLPTFQLQIMLQEGSSSTDGTPYCLLQGIPLLQAPRRLVDLGDLGKFYCHSRFYLRGFAIHTVASPVPLRRLKMRLSAAYGPLCFTASPDREETPHTRVRKSTK
ncbi:hypothetical protein cyc_03725 [Cyclospora cayetanensis]|uniref:Uncharacterized protein n=1 Tax=Cyclospora cayetanensis TaxID=88456 RepID=A0A1D3D9U9_9EIME|nr:hypothetical protein cyc_03725 [Cyclospora cayetanensis]